MSCSPKCFLCFIAMHTWKSWYKTGTRSFESWTSNSTRSAPADAAFFSDAIVFSRTSAHLQCRKNVVWPGLWSRSHGVSQSQKESWMKLEFVKMYQLQIQPQYKILNRHYLQ
jgi:hypothetical protein